MQLIVFILSINCCCVGRNIFKSLVQHFHIIIIIIGCFSLLIFSKQSKQVQACLVPAALMQPARHAFVFYLLMSDLLTFFLFFYSSDKIDQNPDKETEHKYEMRSRKCNDACTVGTSNKEAATCFSSL